jgi:hypothetical protein
VSIEFPLRSKLTSFGRVSDPTIPVAVQTLAGERTYMFLLDTGADFSVALRRLAHQVGLEWTALPEAQVVGLEPGGVRARVGQLPIRVGSLACTVRCLFMDTPRTLINSFEPCSAHWCVSWETLRCLPHRLRNLQAMLHALRTHSLAFTGFLRANV